MQGDGPPVLGLQFLRRWGQPVRRAGDMTRPVPHSSSLRANSVPARSVDAPNGAVVADLDDEPCEGACCCRFRRTGGRMKQMACRRLRDYLMRSKLAATLAVSFLVMAVVPAWAASPPAAAAVVPTVVTIEWHDGNADQIGALPILDNPARPMHATWLVN